MKCLFAVSVTAMTWLCVGCSERPLPTSPSSVAPVNPSPDATAVAASARGARISSLSEKLVPFIGTLEGTQTLTPTGPGVGFVNGSGTGNATQLGGFTVAFPHTVDFATRTGDGTYTFTAANGDTVTAKFKGEAAGGPIVSIVETANITGGTGRFAGASGSFIVTRTFNLATGITEGSFEGAISSVGSQP